MTLNTHQQQQQQPPPPRHTNSCVRHKLRGCNNLTRGHVQVSWACMREIDSCGWAVPGAAPPHRRHLHRNAAHNWPKTRARRHACANVPHTCRPRLPYHPPTNFSHQPCSKFVPTCARLWLIQDTASSLCVQTGVRIALVAPDIIKCQNQGPGKYMVVLEVRINHICRWASLVHAS